MRFALFLLAASTGFTAENRDAIFQKSIETMFPKLVEIRRDIHSHPELSNEEARTSKRVEAHLRSLGTFRIFECRDCGIQYCYLCYGSNEGKRCPSCKSTDAFTAGTCYPK